MRINTRVIWLFYHFQVSKMGLYMIEDLSARRNTKNGRKFRFLYIPYMSIYNSRFDIFFEQMSSLILELDIMAFSIDKE